MEFLQKMLSQRFISINLRLHLSVVILANDYLPMLSGLLLRF